MKRILTYFIILFMPLALLAGCGKDKRLSLDDRIGEFGQEDSYEGIIERLESLDVYQQGTHKLLTDDYGVLIVQSPSIDLNRYLDEEVLVKGSVEKGIGDAIDVFSVIEISYIDESRSAELADYENKQFGFRFSHPSNWLLDEGQSDLGLKFEETEIFSLAVFSGETDLSAFAASREDDEPTEVTIGAQKALRFVSGSQLGFYVPNPPKKKIYLIKYDASSKAVDDDLFYDLLESFELIFLSQVQGDMCGGHKQLGCPDDHICQLDSDGKYAEGVCVEINGESTQTGCPFIAPPTNCNEYRISEYSLKGCPTRYECVGAGTDTESVSLRDLNVVDAGDKPLDFQSTDDKPQDESIDDKPLDSQSVDGAEQEDVEEKEYEVPELSDVTTEYINKRKAFTMLMPKSWYYASFGPVDGTLWKVGFADVALEETEEAIITMTLMDEPGGAAYKKIEDIYYTFDGPADLVEIMEEMAESVEAF